MRAALILALLVGCSESDPCAPFAGETCIALRVDGVVPVDQLGVAVLGAFAEKPTPDPRRETPLALPVQMALLPGDISGPTLIVARGFRLGVAVGEGTTSVVVTPRQHTRASVALIANGVDLAGVDVAGVDLATPPGVDLARSDAQVATPALFEANQGLFGGTVTCVLADFAMRGAFVGTSGAGVFHSDDAGATWTAVNSGLKERFVDVLGASPVGAGFFAAVHDNSRNALYRSMDGRTWTKQSDLPSFATVIEFVGAFTMLVGTDSSGVLRSSDNGVTLVPVNTGTAAGFRVRSLVADVLASGTVYLGAYLSPTVYKTVNAGDQWTMASTGLPTALGNEVGAMAFDPASRDLIAASRSLFVLPSGTTTWQSFSPPLPSPAPAPFRLAFAQQNPRDFYVSTVGMATSVYHLGGSDATWRDAANGLTTPGDVLRLAMDRSDSRVLFAASEDHGVFVTTNSAAMWQRSVNGLRNLPVTSLAVDAKNPNVLVAGSLHDGVYRSIDGGDTWSQMTNGIAATASVTAVAIHPTQTVVYAATLERDASGSPSSGAIFRSTDGGSSWQSVDARATDALAFDKNGTLYAVDHELGAVRKSTNGTAFVTMSNGLDRRAEALAVHPSDPTIVYAATNSGVYKSADGAVSWQPISSTVVEAFLHSIAVSPAQPDLVFAGGSTKVYRSTNAGATWMEASSGLDGTSWEVRVAPSDAKIVYAASNKGLWKSSDGGDTWTLLSSDFGLATTRDLAIHPTNPAAAWFGVFNGVGVVKTITGGK